MKLILSALFFGAASAIIDNQQPLIERPLNEYESISTSSKNDFDDIKLKSELAEDDILAFVDAMSRIFKPKTSTRKPDNAWDYIIKGSDIHDLWIENSSGEVEREIEGNFESYNLRAKKVDPARLGVDTVKQYSGYLDDNENDKHLFYCKLNLILKV